MTDESRVSDERLSEIANGAKLETTTETGYMIVSMAVELIRARRVGRQDSRRAEQIKKLRWAVENTLGKIEALAKADLELIAAQDRAEAAEDAAAAAERRARELAAELRKERQRLTGAMDRGLDIEAISDIVEHTVKGLELIITRIEAL